MDVPVRSPGRGEVVAERLPLAYPAVLRALAGLLREHCAPAGAEPDAPARGRVGMRLRFADGHAAFRLESMLNTPLFAGFPGFVSKLWLAHDEHGRYRGVYEWDGPRLAENYARALWRVLALVSVRGSIHYVVLPGLRRDTALEEPHLLAGAAAGAAWGRLAEAA